MNSWPGNHKAVVIKAAAERCVHCPHTVDSRSIGNGDSKIAYSILDSVFYVSVCVCVCAQSVMFTSRFDVF